MTGIQLSAVLLSTAMVCLSLDIFFLKRRVTRLEGIIRNRRRRQP